MIVIKKENPRYFFDRNEPPVLSVKPGAEVTFETFDAALGNVRSVEEFLRFRSNAPNGNPMAGPVYVEGAEPGRTLVVDILKIELDADGFQLIGPNRAIVREEISEWSCYVFRVENGRVIFPNGLEVPADPIIGQFGTAPAGEPTNCPNPLGGNIDCPFVREGSRIYLPVEVEGALFSLGDVHACQGDGEVVGAPEVGARVTVRMELLRQRLAKGFMIEDPRDWHSCSTADNEGEAARQAVLQNAYFIGQRYGVDFRDALILLTLIGRLTISRTNKWGAHNPVVCSSFSKILAEEATRTYHPT